VSATASQCLAAPLARFHLHHPCELIRSVVHRRRARSVSPPSAKKLRRRGHNNGRGRQDFRMTGRSNGAQLPRVLPGCTRFIGLPVACNLSSNNCWIAKALHRLCMRRVRTRSVSCSRDAGIDLRTLGWFPEKDVAPPQRAVNAGGAVRRGVEHGGFARCVETGKRQLLVHALSEF